MSERGEEERGGEGRGGEGRYYGGLIGRCKDDRLFYLRSLLSSSYVGYSFLILSAELAEALSF